MKQKIYDTKQQEIVEFVPQEAGRVGMYVCGPTVQSAPHIGHLRSALVYDQVRRWFEATGLDVTLIRNVTDIDDKILVNAAASQDESGVGEAWWALASRVEREFAGVYATLGIAEPTAAPRATGHITQMITLIERLIAAGHAYQASDGSANVYFDAGSWERYGELTRQRVTEMENSDEPKGAGKRNPQDFALWKAYRDTEPETASWPSPWGVGRPGWHIECSAMATHYLGESFDLHGGGLDLRFPHHENELAQSAAAGMPFARHWMHNGLVNISGQKMSKSLGNSIFAADLLAEAKPIVVRYFLGSAHYRSQLDYSDNSLDEAAAAFARIEAAVARAAAELEGVEALIDTEVVRSAFALLPAEFVAAMQDDFAIPTALAQVHGAVRQVNSLLDSGDKTGAQAAAKSLVAMLAVLHLDPRHPDWAGKYGVNTSLKKTLDMDVNYYSGGSGEEDIYKRAIRKIARNRDKYRKRKDFQNADIIRLVLTEGGIEIIDTTKGPEFRSIE